MQTFKAIWGSQLSIPNRKQYRYWAQMPLAASHHIRRLTTLRLLKNHAQALEMEASIA